MRIDLNSFSKRHKKNYKGFNRKSTNKNAQNNK